MKRQFKVIPVLDLKDGLVVRGIRGERDKYLPVQSALTTSAEYTDVLEAFYQGFGFTEFYIADLDALISGGRRNHLGLIGQRKKIKIPGLSFMADAGVHDAASVMGVCQTGVEKVIVGTETLPSFKDLREIIQAVGESRRLVVSIDTKDRKVIGCSAEIAGLSPFDVIREIRKTGIRDFILLQLARVGTKEGLDKPFIQDCLRVLTDIDLDCTSLLVGGGISGYEDLRWLADNGLDGALVASALHDRRLTPGAVRKLHQNA
ncbi:HisA/HisF-related TIM barrel protein [Desulfoscipio sp. XC116]|uniref:HisA/HisF-related TIM barrel protein n=1 Tax=Desulfoscipio sp. XC116 TaxID=3144975 RepID=UPI00325AC060